MRSWTRGKATPSPVSRERIDAAYWWRRRENLIRSGWLARHLDNDGRGSRMEIYPVDQSHVDAKYSRPFSDRSITVRYIWPDLVHAWATRNATLVASPRRYGPRVRPGARFDRGQYRRAALNVTGRGELAGLCGSQLVFPGERVGCEPVVRLARPLGKPSWVSF
ncbi:hypothetical protein [Streptomyces sp. NPDC056544]|uniref:hypothetical protein n=1 Tax=unclassified Streptomyces TaxID=2593676 RepID=UPI00368CB1A9